MRHSLLGQVVNWAGWFLRTRAPNPLNIVKSCPCEFWFDGQDTGTLALNGNKVIQWDDKSGNARHVSNAVDAQRPTYDPVTGRLTFVAANSTYLQSAAFDAALTQPNTIYILYKIIGVLSDSEMVFAGTVALNDEMFRFSANTFRMRTSADLIGAATDANNNIHSGEFNGITSNYWINGTLVAGPGDVGLYPLDGITFGCNYIKTANFADVEIMEVFGYNCLITEAERIKCENYLYKKWGLTY